jgi:hypothetical protein
VSSPPRTGSRRCAAADAVLRSPRHGYTRALIEAAPVPDPPGVAPSPWPNRHSRPRRPFAKRRPAIGLRGDHRHRGFRGTRGTGRHRGAQGRRGGGAGALHGFVSVVAIGADGRLHRAEIQDGGTAAMLADGPLAHRLANATRAGLMSSGPNRPAPLSQFTRLGS